MSVISQTKPSNHLVVHGSQDQPNPGDILKDKNIPKKTQNKAQSDGSFKSLKYTNEIQTIFPMKHQTSTWEEDLKTKYKLVEDTNWDKGFTVWRSLPMQSELEQKINVHNVPLKRSSDFTRKSKPEAYLPGFSVRKAGPIARPRDALPVRRMPVPSVVVKKEVKVKKEPSQASEELLTERRESGPTLQDGILR